MARFKADEVEHYGGQGGGGFFGIAKDKEVKRVRFMYRTVDDIQGDSVHKVNVGDKERYVNCLRNYNDPLDVCPFCASKRYPVQARLFIPIYNIEEDTVQIWDRGKTMFQKLISQCSRYANKDVDVVNNVFEIERNGKPKDKKTTYEIYWLEKDDTQMEDLPDEPEIVGGVVLDKSADDMEYYLETGEFPPTEDEEEEAPVRRRDARPASRERERDTRDREVVRRTPRSSRNNNDEDAF